ncbi:MAG: RNA recognition motif domain-containing protein [Stellaceae bacterium]
MRSRNSRGNLFVANLPTDFDDERLAEVFDACGIVLSASVARDPASGKRLRYGFVDIATERAAQRAISTLNGTAVDGHKLDVRISEPKSQPKKPPPAPRGSGESGTQERSFGTPPRRRTQGFVVERRPLPRRV